MLSIWVECVGMYFALLMYRCHFSVSVHFLLIIINYFIVLSCEAEYFSMDSFAALCMYYSH